VKTVEEWRKPEYHEIEPNPWKERSMHEGDHHFLDEFMKFIFFFA
jgi:hypothetical protein